MLLVICLTAELLLQAKVEIDSDNALAAANATAGAATLEAERIKASVSWRRITLEQCKKLSNALRGKIPSLRVDFPLGDPVSLEYADSLRDCLLGGAHVVAIIVPEQVTRLVTGLRLVGDNASLVATVRSAFVAAQIPIGPPELPGTTFGITWGQYFGAPDATILVGSKPVL